MLVKFFFELRAAGVPVSLTELLMLLQGLQAQLAFISAQQFYFLARLTLVKDERFYDRFDRVFAEHFRGAERLFAALETQLPPEWLASVTRRLLSEEEKRQVEALGGWDQLLETLRARLAERRRQQMDRHRRHRAFRPWWLQSRGCAHRRPGWAAARGADLGTTRVSELRRRGGAGHA